MNVKSLRYLFILISILLAVLMLFMSRKAGVNCDEVLHYNQSVAVYNYFTTGGVDKSALDTPVTHLKYYGQSYDNLTTFLIRIFNIEDIYGFRHLMSSVAGWLVILVTALLAVWLSGYETGILVMLLFAVSPTFLGHAQNNLKDIPFALGYISAIFFTIRFLSSERKIPVADSIFLVFSIAFCISIRAGGLLLYFYFILFFVAWFIIHYIKEGNSIITEIKSKALAGIIVIIFSYFLSILLWPYALQDPIRNPFLSYKIMLRFPDTFRQIFEGRAEWSDYMPWYYLAKSMIITIPLAVTGGGIILLLFFRKIIKSGKLIFYCFLLFAFAFPLVVVMIKRPNLYSSWRHFLFLYPVLIVLSATGINFLLGYAGKWYWKLSLFAALILASLNPAGFILRNTPYSYLYYNQLEGGLKGALGNYETDYYFVSQRESAEWLIKYLKDKGIKDKIVVGANFSVEWFFRNEPQISAIYFRNEERSMYDWDYVITTNRYIPPFRLRSSGWPSSNALKVIDADGVPLGEIVKRESKAAYYGYRALEEGDLEASLSFFKEAITINSEDEMIFYNFADALSRAGQPEMADSMLKRCLELNPEFEPALMYSGLRARAGGREEEAAGYFEKLIGLNRKYFEAYIELAAIRVREDAAAAREILLDCIRIKPDYRPAIEALADIYRQSDPETAEKYYELLRNIN